MRKFGDAPADRSRLYANRAEEIKAAKIEQFYPVMDAIAWPELR